MPKYKDAEANYCPEVTDAGYIDDKTHIRY